MGRGPRCGLITVAALRYLAGYPQPVLDTVQAPFSAWQRASRTDPVRTDAAFPAISAFQCENRL